MNQKLDQLTKREEEKFWRYVGFRTRNRNKLIAKEQHALEHSDTAQDSDYRPQEAL